MSESTTFSIVKEEELQTHRTRKALYGKLSKLMGMPVVSFFTSFMYPVMIEDSDAETMEAVLRVCDLSNGFALIVNSPGGRGLAAERIIRICRAYSGTGEYVAIVPGKAKSAATMICLGASKIIMGRTSELGPVDPQVTVTEDEELSRFSVYNLVKSYESLFDRAVKASGNIQPYLLQLANYDERDIAEYRTALSLSDDIAIRALKGGMLRNMSEVEIKRKIGIFLIPEKRAKVHGRPIYAEEASKCDLNVEIREVKDNIWNLLYELYIRLDNFVSINRNSKIIECYNQSYRAGFSEEE